MLQRNSHCRKKLITVVKIDRRFFPEFNSYHNKARILHVIKWRKSTAAQVSMSLSCFKEFRAKRAGMLQGRRKFTSIYLLI